MRRRTLLLAAGLLAYLVGASVRVYLRRPDFCACNVGCRVVAAIDHPRATLRHPLGAIHYLATPACKK